VTETPTTEQLAEREARYDVFHEFGELEGMLKTLRAQAWGDELPEEVDPSSSCTWSVLGDMVGWLRLHPGALLVDLGCGRGGTGLWLARAFNARLLGLDISTRGLEIARRHAAGFLPADRAEFRHGTFERTGLPDACADGVISMDALPFAFDRDAALAELRRILRPGARAVFTGVHRLPGHPAYDAAVPRWPDLIRNAGLELEAEIARPEEPGLWERLYAGLAEHEEQVRREIGDAGADLLYEEVDTAGPTVQLREPVLYVARAPQ
jgi:SAM-dependent methyltransferase